MIRLWIAASFALLAGCSGIPPAQLRDDPCAAGETTYACQVQRYNDVSAP